MFFRNRALHFIIFLCMLPVAVAWSSSAGIAVCYLLAVLWMTLCFHIMDLMAHRH